MSKSSRKKRKKREQEIQAMTPEEESRFLAAALLNNSIRIHIRTAIESSGLPLEEIASRIDWEPKRLIGFLDSEGCVTTKDVADVLWAVGATLDLNVVKIDVGKIWKEREEERSISNYRNLGHKKKSFRGNLVRRY